MIIYHFVQITWKQKKRDRGLKIESSSFCVYCDGAKDEKYDMQISVKTLVIKSPSMLSWGGKSKYLLIGNWSFKRDCIEL